LDKGWRKPEREFGMKVALLHSGFSEERFKRRLTFALLSAFAMVFMA
jgi:hypothetical protein